MSLPLWVHLWLKKMNEIQSNMSIVAGKAIVSVCLMAVVVYSSFGFVILSCFVMFFSFHLILGVAFFPYFSLFTVSVYVVLFFFSFRCLYLLSVLSLSLLHECLIFCLLAQVDKKSSYVSIGC